MSEHVLSTAHVWSCNGKPIDRDAVMSEHVLRTAHVCSCNGM